MSNLTVGKIEFNNHDLKQIRADLTNSIGTTINDSISFCKVRTFKQYKIKTDDLTMDDIKLILSKITFSDYHWLDNIIPEHLKEEF